MYGIAAPAPICADPSPFDSAQGRQPADQADCQVIVAPSSRTRLVPAGATDPDAEIRLTYSELTALIEDAIRALK
jgi:hypothetical protein